MMDILFQAISIFKIFIRRKLNLNNSQVKSLRKKFKVMVLLQIIKRFNKISSAQDIVLFL